tara:strand:+ start:798 stop:1124 length:327 start_codon:yes stop_codon:yes gene_type:complete
MQIFINLFGENKVYDIDQDLTISQLKDLIDDREFIPTDLHYLTSNSRILTNGTLIDNELSDGSNIILNLRIKGGTRYKKSSAQMRWKWKKKRTKRLQRRRRRMRNRAK